MTQRIYVAGHRGMVLVSHRWLLQMVKSLACRPCGVECAIDFDARLMDAVSMSSER